MLVISVKLQSGVACRMQARGRGPSFTVVSVSVMGDGLD